MRIERGPLDAALAIADAGPVGNSVPSLGVVYKLGASKLMLQRHAGKRDGERWRSGLVGVVVPLASVQLLAAASRIEQRSGGAARRTLFAAGVEHPLSPTG